MKRQLLMMLMTVMSVTTVWGDDWNTICASGEYYYGMGRSTSQMEARNLAMAQLASMIGTTIVGRTEINADEKKETISNYLESQTRAEIINLEWQEDEKLKSGEYVCRCSMKKTELSKIEARRQQTAQNMVAEGMRRQQEKEPEQALKNYYWALKLLSALQSPSAEAARLKTKLPNIIEKLLNDIKFSVIGRDGNRVELNVEYKGQPVPSLRFAYFDGKYQQEGNVSDGKAVLDMNDGGLRDEYDIDVEYQFRNEADSEPEMKFLMTAGGGRRFKAAEKRVRGKNMKKIPQEPVDKKTATTDTSGVYAGVVKQVMEAIGSGSYESARGCFTEEGYRRYNQLIGYGKGRIMDSLRMVCHESVDGKVVVRGLQMSFCFNHGKKRTFVENVAFTFDKQRKIENVAFGVGRQTETDIMQRHPGWSQLTREMLLEFLESYKTAYCLKRLDYIEQVFASNATIIVGHVAKRAGRQPGHDGAQAMLTDRGREVITYNRLTKDEYLKNLKKVFNRNEYVNLNFTQCDIQTLDKFKDKGMLRFGIGIRQEYNSSTYGDEGWLYLDVDMTDAQKPTIYIRTWQPHETDVKELFNAGKFYD